MKKFLDFPGSTINDKIVTMNTYHQSHGGRILEPVEFPSQLLRHTVPIEWWSGLRIHSEAAIHPAREYTRQTTLKYEGSGSQFVFKFNQQGYPGDGSPRDISVAGIQLEGTPNNTLFPVYDLTKYGQLGPGHVLWMSQFHNCGFKNFRRLNATWWDGVSFTGSTHVQHVAETPFWVDGAECNLIGHDGFSFFDNADWDEVPLPFIRVRGRKMVIGRVMITARGFSYQIAVDEGTYNLVMNQVHFDSQDAAPVFGASLRINGGHNIVGTELSFKGQADNLAAAFEGGIIHIAGGSGITIANSNFERRGTRAVPSTPIVWIDARVPDNSVFLSGLNCVGFDGIVSVARRAQLSCADTRLKVVTR